MHSFLRRVAPAVIAAIFASNVAYADEPPATTLWYGWQTLAVDAGLFGTSLALARVNASGATALGVSGYLLGAPFVHFAHGNVGKGFLDGGLRAGAAVVGVLGGIFAGAASNKGSLGSLLDGMEVGSEIGLAVGCITAVTLDAAVLAREKVPAAADRPVSFAPTFAVTARGASAGLGGTF